MGYLGIDPRHIEPLADVMTYKGGVLGITHFGLTKARDSVLHLASFEKPLTIYSMLRRHWRLMVLKVSESIVLGQPMLGDTGSFQVVCRLGVQPAELVSKPTLFEHAWNVEVKTKRQRGTA